MQSPPAHWKYAVQAAPFGKEPGVDMHVKLLRSRSSHDCAPRSWSQLRIFVAVQLVPGNDPSDEHRSFFRSMHVARFPQVERSRTGSHSASRLHIVVASALHASVGSSGGRVRLEELHAETSAFAATRTAVARARKRAHTLVMFMKPSPQESRFGNLKQVTTLNGVRKETIERPASNHRPA